MLVLSESSHPKPVYGDTGFTFSFKFKNLVNDVYILASGGKLPFVIHRYQVGAVNRFWQFEALVGAQDVWPSDFPIWVRLFGQKVKIKSVHSNASLPSFYPENVQEVTPPTSSSDKKNFA